MKRKFLSTILALVLILSSVVAIPTFATSGITYSDPMTYDATNGINYDISDCSIFWIRQGGGALIWVPASDTRTDEEIIAQVISADPSISSTVERFDILRGTGIKYTPNLFLSKAKIIVCDDGEFVSLFIQGQYDYFITGSKPATDGTPVVPVDPVDPVVPVDPANTMNLRIDTPAKMAVRFEDGTVVYSGESKTIVIGQEYKFQMVSCSWETGRFSDGGEGICGSVVYTMKVVSHAEFVELRTIAVADPDRYTVKGMDIIDNDAKTIIIDASADNVHLETDVNNFFMAYRYHFTRGDYNKQTGIEGVVNTPIESLSVNLPLGSTIKSDAYLAYNYTDTAYVFVERNSGSGVYENTYLTSVNDYYWAY